MSTEQEIVDEVLANAKTIRPRAPTPMGAPPDEVERQISMIRASAIKPEPIAWLWDGYLALGKLHVLGGAPGTGKTTIAMALAATVTMGGRWADGERASTGSVVIWSGEDDPADTLVPRLALSGADLNRVHFIGDVQHGSERRSFDPARDIQPLLREIAKIGDVRLVIVDPVVSAILGDSHKNAEVRRGLQPLVDLASTMGCAVLGITHFSKGTGGRDPVERITGSLAFGALARVVMVAAKHKTDGDDGRTTRLFCRAKSNIGSDYGGFKYELRQAPMPSDTRIEASYVLWGDAVDGEARDLLAQADAVEDDEGSALADAKMFLKDLLSQGALPSKTVKADADGAGYSWITVRRAKDALGVIVSKERMNGSWFWSLPDSGSAYRAVRGDDDA